MKHILAIDDNGTDLQIIRGTLQRFYTVSLMNSGERALKFLEKQIPDLILLDILMIGMDGIETLRQIKKMPNCKDIPVIMLTSVSEDKLLKECIGLGARGLISKPFLPGRMLEVVERTLQDADT